jgi:hypothetical protein
MKLTIEGRKGLVMSYQVIENRKSQFAKSQITK